jgi:hypothetical protein
VIRWLWRPRNTKAWPEKGSRARLSWTRAASPSKPLRMSVCPVPARRPSRTGRGLSTEQRGDRALQARQVRPGCGPHPMPAGQLDLDETRPGRHVGCGRSWRWQGERDVGRWGCRSRGPLLGQQDAPPSEQQAGVQTVPAGYLRGCRARIVRLGQDGALLLGRPDLARARNNAMRRVGHRSRHKADTTPSDIRHRSQSKTLQAQGRRHQELTLKAISRIWISTAFNRDYQVAVRST